MDAAPHCRAALDGRVQVGEQGWPPVGPGRTWLYSRAVETLAPLPAPGAGPLPPRSGHLVNRQQNLKLSSPLVEQKGLDLE